jgi:nucleotide-binding universal stress UspA family protein
MLKEGDVAAEIVRAEEQVPADLIVLGSHGKTAEARRMMGSVAEAVLRRARCPVLTVRGEAAKA